MSKNPSSSFINFPDAISMNASASKSGNDSQFEYVIIFKNRPEMQNYVSDHNVLGIYPNLNAIKQGIYPVDVPQNEIIKLSKSFTLDQTTENPTLAQTEVNPTGNTLNLTQLWDLGYNGTGKNIAVLDNGIIGSHPYLLGKVLETKFEGKNGFQSCGTHGTAVAGVAVGYNPNDMKILGTGYGSKLVNVEFSCIGATIEGDFLGAFDYVLSHNDTIDVVNTSFGGFASSWDPLVAKLTQAGIIVVGSAGNSGPSYHTTTTGGPGNSVHGISIGSINYEGKLSGFSSRGPALYMTTKPDFLAPGENILTSNPDGKLSSFSGTSFSSPEVAGAITTLLSALTANNISYNPGLIKAALIETSNKVQGSQLAVGNGIPNIGKAFDFLQQHSDLVTFVENTLPNDYLKNIPRGHQLKLPITIVSSFPQYVSLQFTGDLNGISISHDPIVDYSQSLILNIDTSQFQPFTNVNGSIIATLGNYSKEIPISFSIGDNKKATIGVDLYHTYFDQFGADSIGGSKIGTALADAMQQGFAIKEIQGSINATVLGDVDILWLPDPLNILNSRLEPLNELGFTQSDLSFDEIGVIHTFVNSGKNLLITTNGLLDNSPNNVPSLYGLNITQLNSLTNLFGMVASNYPVSTKSGIVNAELSNSTNLIGSARSISHFGNFIETNNNAFSLGQIFGNTTMAYYQNITSGGKVLFSSSNYWLDNQHLTGFNANGDKIIAENLWNWFIEDDALIKTSQEFSNSIISGSFQFKNQTVLDHVTFSMEKNYKVVDKNISPVISGNEVSFSTSLQSEGRFRVIATYGTQYLGWEQVNDLTGPDILLSNDFDNGTNFGNDTFIIISYKISDKISDIDLNSLEFQLDGITYYPINSYSQPNHQLSVVLNPNQISHNTFHILTVKLSDIYHNYNSNNFQFSINLQKTKETVRSSISERSALFTDQLLLIPVIVMIRKSIKNRKFSNNPQI